MTAMLNAPTDVRFRGQFGRARSAGRSQFLHPRRTSAPFQNAAYAVTVHALSLGGSMRRRQFIAGLGGALAIPIAARAQPRQRSRRIGLLLPAHSTDPEFQTYVGAFLQGLQQAGWVIGRNVQVEYRWTEGDPDNTRKYIAELVALAPDAIVAQGASAVRAILQSTRTVPIVFPVAGDPVGAGLVETLARPGGNVTGFMNFEYRTSAKWLELLKQIAPSVARVAVLRDPATPTGTAQFGVIEAAASAFRVDVVPVNVGAADDFERGVTNFALRPNGGLIATANLSVFEHRKHIIELAARHKLPAIYPGALFPKGGGLVSYGPDILDQYRRAADYVDRILKGEKPANLPVQAPTKYNLVINLKTAKALGLELPPTLLATADEVIE